MLMVHIETFVVVRCACRIHSRSKGGGHAVVCNELWYGFVAVPMNVCVEMT
jgi:hypothetical protein